MIIECPNCGKEHDVTDKLPSCACDDATLDCDCGTEITYGWVAEAEVRSSKPIPAD